MSQGDKMRAIVIDVDQEDHYAVRTVVKPEELAGDFNTLRWLYREISCSGVEVVMLSEDIHMWVDDEGMYNSPINHLATHVAQRFGFVFQPYYGNVMFTGGATAGGETLGLSPDAGVQIIELIRQVTGE